MRIHGKLTVLVIFVGLSHAAIIGDVLDGLADVKEKITDEIFTNEIVQWAQGGNKSEIFNRIIRQLALPTKWQRLDWANFDNLRGEVLGIICKATTKAFLILRRAGTPVDTIQATIANLCTLLNLQTKTVCHGVVRLNIPIIQHIVDSDPSINHNDVCGLVLQNQPCCRPPQRYEWSVPVDGGAAVPVSVQPSRQQVKILQVTDIHYDPLYEPGGNADCADPTCCRVGQNRSLGNSKSAGFWGDYNNCDAPWHAVLDALDEMKSRHGDADLIYFTGDIIDHGVWETSRSTNAKSLVKIYRKIKETFGNKPVYPILGNHEPHPLNQFAPDNIDEDHLSTRWLYNLLADIWIDAGWLPESTRPTIQHGGYYTVSPTRGFRIIAINNNVAYIYNWWLIFKPRDPNDQLKWLAQTLLEAERNHEVVHILGHMPSGSHHAQHTWSREYRKIINRFAHIITAQFNGHTHFDEFNVFYHPSDKSRIINVAWNGGSITTYTNLNPNYKIYTANSATYEIEDAETWTYNLTTANLTPDRRPSWYKLYSFKDEYGLRNLSKDSLHNLIVNMAKGGNQLDTYHRNYYKHAAPELEKDCDSNCLQEHVCTIVTSASGDKSECKHLEEHRTQSWLPKLPKLRPLTPYPLPKFNLF